MRLRTTITAMLLASAGSLASGQEAATDAAAQPVVVGNLEHQGWALAGQRGRHYFFGGLAIADYVYQGERRIVTLQRDEPTLLPKPDKNFLYYRELESGHRWAVGREPLASGRYVIYYQRKGSGLAPDASSATKGEAKKAWQEFQRSRLEWKQPAAAADSKWVPRARETALESGHR